jgi:FtsZ-binding cell division protein ZapB
MAEMLTERLEQLEQSVRRAADTVARLKAERDALHARVAALEVERQELQRLKAERTEVMAQVDAILKELDKLAL